MKAVSLRNLVERLRRLGPYVLIELVLPGGTLLALLLWISSGAGRGQFAEPQQVPIEPVAIARLVELPR